ncbi:MAG: polyprenyl diphosphate synthase [Myxococcales bacterium]|nr:polyprenyl diphosphate synthase [Myxococcales bacterium]
MQRLIRQARAVATGAAQVLDPSRSVDSGEAPDWFARYGIRHVAVIPDGNRRWARDRRLAPMIGHTTGLLETLPRLVRGLSARNVHTVTAWGFSTENWSRARSEVEHLMKIFADFLENQVLQIAEDNDGRLVHLGRKDRLPDSVLSRIEHAEKVTRDNRSHVYNMAIDYGGQDELERAARRMREAIAGGADPAALGLQDFLDTAGQPHPNPDLIIRSSGEQRMSGFMPLQSIYTELFFVEQQFPEFNIEMLDAVADQFGARKRRYGS